MKMTREKVIQLSHRILGAIEELDEVEIFDEPNNIRQEVVKILNDLLHEEEKVDEAVRQKIIDYILKHRSTGGSGGSYYESALSDFLDYKP